jgi:hypothetical protein
MAIGELTEHDAAALLNDLRTGLNADGYDLEVSGVDDKVELTIVARDDACEDCLVPKDVMGQIMAAALQQGHQGITAEDIVLRYPAEH